MVRTPGVAASALTVGTSLVWILLVAVLVVRWITNPLSRLTSGMKRKLATDEG